MATIRTATSDDLPLVLAFIRELAEYERLSHDVTATEEGLRTALFGERPGAEVLLAFEGDEPAGFAVFFHNFSTFVGRRGLYLEDLFVRPAMRRCGIGKQLLRHLAGIARDRGCGRFEWTVLDWNAPAIAFYRRLGARVLEDWRVCRMDAAGIARLADGLEAGAAPRSAPAA